MVLVLHVLFKCLFFFPLFTIGLIWRLANPIQKAEICHENGIEVDGAWIHYKGSFQAHSKHTILLLHGFPSTSTVWKSVFNILSKTLPVNVIAPDLPGHGQSEKIRIKHLNSAEHAALILLRLLQKLDLKRVIVVGHDWGGVVGYRMAMEAPSVVERVVLLNAPHPLQPPITSLKYQLQTLYIPFFSIPFFPEYWLQRHNYAFLDRTYYTGNAALLNTSNWSESDHCNLKESFYIPNSIYCSLAYYNNWNPSNWFVAKTKVLGVWSVQDPFFTDNIEAYYRNNNIPLIKLYNSRHWPQLDEPESVCNIIVSHLFN